MAANPVSQTQEVPNMVPEYEVRLQLNPAAVLGPDHKLTSTVLSTFGIPQTNPTNPIKLNVQFLDTSCKELYTAGWSARIRKTENEDDFELTYKKRYPIRDGDIDAALAAANNDGFNAASTKYEAQVEWGYQNQTLSISRKKSIADSENSRMNLPGTSRSIEMLSNEAPDKFNNWRPNSWGTSTLAISRIFGPVCASRCVGTWNQMRLYLEVWPLKLKGGTGIEHIVEASFKTKSRQTAADEKNHLAHRLDEMHWFLAQDSLKTQLIMERY
ncbi:hypothetical protein BDV38DRAFT_280613 [Aspergillus pseudotamarii]|uniref:CYTH-like domain-containing protein n=1 Tax=Aspergillus pseudotamarii TaxID=132259 RepID=A0A5N6T1E2_ASPPS|nr:uncharacterized protein BDV38DRAFT_280613 [Aspergillus pseudotamarii]KAE8140149.1 hypothetical protein BDV38DRAFT_280613 [Aspergillus pseudotamarii]